MVRLVYMFEELEIFFLLFSEVGVDVFYCLQCCYWEFEFEGSELNLVGWIKKLIGKFIIIVGLVGLNDDFFGVFKGQDFGMCVVDDLLERLDVGEFDLVVVGCVLL